MAGRYVILEFDSKDMAEAFLANDKALQYDGATVVAEYLKPNKFCTCPDKLRQDNRNWRKHKKYGLYICARCKLPSKHHERGILGRLQYVFGYNLRDA